MVSNVETSTRLRQARDEFLSSGSVDDGLISGTVRDSWQRSRDLRVHPDRVDLPFVREPDLDSPLVVAASPVVRRLGEDLAAQSVSIVLTSADGLVLDRAATSTGLPSTNSARSKRFGFS